MFESELLQIVVIALAVIGMATLLRGLWKARGFILKKVVVPYTAAVFAGVGLYFVTGEADAAGVGGGLVLAAFTYFG